MLTRKDALKTAILALTDTEYTLDPSYSNKVSGAELRAVLTQMFNQLDKPRNISEEAKQAQNAKRREANAAKRAAVMAKVIPVLRKVLADRVPEDGWYAEQIFIEAGPNLPADYNKLKVQHVLLNEMRPEVDVIEAKGVANRYRLHKEEIEGV